MSDAQRSRDAVKDYYGRVLHGIRDLNADACKCAESLPESHRAILEKIDGEILDRFYGCGSPIPPGLEGLTVLDLGCGTGRDVYLASFLVGPKGHFKVTGDRSVHHGPFNCSPASAGGAPQGGGGGSCC